jgi:hypothetical protein
MKKCSGCFQEKQFTEFNVNQKQSDGLQAYYEGRKAQRDTSE